MELAQKCIKTGEDQNSTPKTKTRAWEMCQELLKEAERDLHLAITIAENPKEKFFIEQQVQLLEALQKKARKP